ncbi:rhamnulokinase family protein [Bacillota bacterium Meth-B3]|nr:rhamnulokinase family protein [Christensenellaceae bacterium]MEA5066242.1 rhamnulokinase family protein [Eubacteriales bacterium]
MGTLHLLGFDFGASSGRAMLGAYEDGMLTLTEVHRFPNDPVTINGRFQWDVQRFFYEMKVALNKCAKQGIALDAIGIDTWGVDYGLIAGNGQLAGIPVHYRDARTDGMMDKAFALMPKAEIFERTGLAFMFFNTLFQLMAMKAQNDPQLKIAEKLLFMPDLLAYFLTGEMGTEYTIASTSQLIDPHTRDWAHGLIERFDLPAHLLTGLQQPGTLRGRLLPAIAEETGVGPVPVIAVASHDTASAVAAVPASCERFAYLSSGTWSLLGAEIREPLSDASVMEANYTNEGGVDGTIRLLKNIMGLWIINECKREWDRRSDAVDFAELVQMAGRAEPFFAVIDVDDPCFGAPGDMPERIKHYCRRTGQRVPEGRGQTARVIYESLALKYRWGIERLEQDLLKHPIEVLHIVGGGSKNAMLNQFTANAIARPVIAGPSEGTVIGNLLVQAMGLGAIRDMKELRACVARSFPTKTFLPEGERAPWDEAYRRLLALL